MGNVPGGRAPRGEAAFEFWLEFQAAVGAVCDEAEALLAAAKAGSVSYSESTRQLLGDDGTGEEAHSLRTADGKKVRVWSLAPESADTVSPEGLDVTQEAGSEPDADTPDEPVVGMVLGERYRIIKKLGEGGMGRVYRARDEKLGVDVALKLWIERNLDARRRQRGLRREVRLARLVTHRNVARIYDLGEWQGSEFVSMEYLEGEELTDRLARDGALDPSEAQAMLVQLCDGLGAAHAVGVVHRDLKPANIFLEKGGRLLILDFGIARGLHAAGQSMTETGGMVGTPLYMAPEQFHGLGVDERADFYALGAVAFEMLTDKPVFEANNVADLAFMHVHKQPPDPETIRTGIPPRMKAVILRCLAKDPADRFASAAEIRALLS